MRVAVVLPELDPEQGGGFTFQRTVFDAIRAAQPSSAHTFTFYAPGARRDGDMRPLGVGRRAVAVRAFHELTRHIEDDILGVPRHLSRPTAFDRSLERDGTDLVWFTTPWALDCELPYVFTVWDLEYLRQPWFPEVSAHGEWARRHRHYKRYVPRASAVIAANAVGAEQVRSAFGVPPERILQLGHPAPSIGPVDGPAARLRAPYLLYPAQLWPHKDHATLLRAMRELAGRGRDYLLVVVGSDKGAGDHVRTLARDLGVTDRVEFRGFVPIDELAALYRGAHALAFPSRFGPENLPPLEAAALGCPAVVADVPGMREQLEDGALYAPPGDVTRFADAVIALEDGSRRAAVVAAARRRAELASADRYVAAVLAWMDDFASTVGLWRGDRGGPRGPGGTGDVH